MQQLALRESHGRSRVQGSYSSPREHWICARIVRQTSECLHACKTCTARLAARRQRTVYLHLKSESVQGSYSSPQELWKQVSPDKEKGWYGAAVAYWDRQDASDAGVLGG